MTAGKMLPRKFDDIETLGNLSSVHADTGQFLLDGCAKLDFERQSGIRRLRQS